MGLRKNKLLSVIRCISRGSLLSAIRVVVDVTAGAHGKKKV